MQPARTRFPRNAIEHVSTIDAGAIPPVDTALTGVAWFGAINEVVARWLLVYDPEPLERAYPTLRALLLRSEVLESHRQCQKVQDAYSLRCIPQVHGAARDAWAYARDILVREANSVTDNPLVFENGDILSGGNFHGQSLAQAADFLTTSLV